MKGLTSHPMSARSTAVSNSKFSALHQLPHSGLSAEIHHQRLTLLWAIWWTLHPSSCRGVLACTCCRDPQRLGASYLPCWKPARSVLRSRPSERRLLRFFVFWAWAYWTKPAVVESKPCSLPKHLIRATRHGLCASLQEVLPCIVKDFIPVAASHTFRHLAALGTAMATVSATLEPAGVTGELTIHACAQDYGIATLEARIDGSMGVTVLHSSVLASSIDPNSPVGNAIDTCSRAALDGRFHSETLPLEGTQLRFVWSWLKYRSMVLGSTVCLMDRASIFQVCPFRLCGRVFATGCTHTG